MGSIDSLCQRLSTYLEPDQVDTVRRSYYYAEQAHTGQFRSSGEPYVTHPLSVAEILCDMHMDSESLVAAMLHDVIEDTPINKAAIEQQFGATVADLVDGVSKLARIKFTSREEKEAENFRKMTLAMAKDIRVILVKLADRVHNMRTLGALRLDKKQRIAKQTQEIYAPIAARLGMNDMRIELENLGFHATYPMRASFLESALKSAREKKLNQIINTQNALEERLAREGIIAQVSIRYKHLFSVYQKMRFEKKRFKELIDVQAFQIVVGSVDACYRALGALHNLYKPVTGEFRDFIAIPKANGYQSLHTKLVGLQGSSIDIQIRTHDMNAMANRGIAAHWLYHSSKEGEDNFGGHNRAKKWVKGLLEIQQQAGDSLEFIENAKMDLFPDEIYVFTPKGKIIELPNKATAVDFAYAVHTDIGNHCIACRVNDRIYNLSSPLQSGQRVSIITSSQPQPHPSWLNFVVTGKARSAIRHYLKSERQHQAIDLGKKLLNQALKVHQSSIETLSEAQQQFLLQHYRFEQLEQLWEDIGMGNRSAFGVSQFLFPDQPASLEGFTMPAALVVDSANKIVHFARCCRPIPGDTIAAHCSAGKGIVVHQESCRNLNDIRSHHPENLSPALWAADISGEFLVGLKIDVKSERGVIASIATRISEKGASIEQIHVTNRDAKHASIDLTAAVSDRIHLANVMRFIRVLPTVVRIQRTRSG